MIICPGIDPAARLQFVINSAAGSSDAQAKRAVIEAALRAGGRSGDLLFCNPAELTGVAQRAATQAFAKHTADLGAFIRARESEVRPARAGIEGGVLLS